MELIIPDGLSCSAHHCNTQVLHWPPLTCICTHVHDIFTVPLQRGSIVLWLCRWGAEPAGGSCSPSTGLGSGWDWADSEWWHVIHIQRPNNLRVHGNSKFLVSWHLTFPSSSAGHRGEAQGVGNCWWKVRFQWFTQQLPSSPRQQLKIPSSSATFSCSSQELLFSCHSLPYSLNFDDVYFL